MPRTVPGAVKLVEAGFDWVDVNFGCPVKKVLGKCRGGYLLSEPKTALGIVARVRDALPPDVPVTVKMRRGMDDSPESRDKFFTILDGAFAAGVAAVTVHGRTVQQRYIGPSQWDFLAEVKRHVGERTILGSGDLFSAEDCLRMMRETAVDGVDGWNAVRADHYDMVVSDVDMPRMNGIKFVTQIKQHAELKSLPVIIVSYKDKEEDRLLGLEAGANYYLTKSSFEDDSLINAAVDLIGEA